MHPDVMLDCEAMGRIMPAWDAGDHDAVRAFLAKSIARLADGGCDFFACPDNTAHIALETRGAGAAVARAQHRRNRGGEGGRARDDAGRRARHAVHDGRAGLSPRAAGGRDRAVLPQHDERADIDRIIFDELVEGVFTTPRESRYVEIIDRLKHDEGCDGVALVCTEIPLLVTPDVSPLPILDSTRLLARAAFEVATGKRPIRPGAAGRPDKHGDCHRRHGHYGRDGQGGNSAMKRTLFAAASAICLAACGSGDKVEMKNSSVEDVARELRKTDAAQGFVNPGQWEQTVTLVEISAPGRRPRSPRR